MSGDSTDKPDPAASKPSDEIARSDRLRQLGNRLDRARVDEEAAKAAEAPANDPASVGRAMRLSSEFIAGVIAGALLGWMVDRFFGTSPWGLIVLLMLGFATGIVNVMRGAGMLGTQRSRK